MRAGVCLFCAACEFTWARILGNFGALSPAPYKAQQQLAEWGPVGSRPAGDDGLEPTLSCLSNSVLRTTDVWAESVIQCRAQQAKPYRDEIPVKW